MQTEIAEAPSRRAGTRRPVCRTSARQLAASLSAATIAPNLLATIVAGQVQEHERAVGGWQAQWQAFPALLLVTSGALGAVADVAQGLEIDAERMRSNLDVTQGLIMAEAVTTALGAKLGRDQAAQHHRRRGEPQGARREAPSEHDPRPRTRA